MLHESLFYNLEPHQLVLIGRMKKLLEKEVNNIPKNHKKHYNLTQKYF